MIEYAIPMFFILTGGPGGGKTSILDELQRRGYHCVEESGRQVIKDQQVEGGCALPWEDKTAFRDLMVERDKKQYLEALEQQGPIFFDRGIPDSIGYSHLEGLSIPKELLDSVKGKFRYQNLVFITPPWKEIYANDSERKQDFDEAVRTYNAVAKAYRELGYELVEVPKVSVKERVAFILEKISLIHSSE